MFLSDELVQIAQQNTGSKKQSGLEQMKATCITYAEKDSYSPEKIAHIWDIVARILKQKNIDSFVREGQMDGWAKEQAELQEKTNKVSNILNTH